MNLFTALNNAMGTVLERDDSAVIFGEDVAFGGVFRCTVDLKERFGAERVFNTPSRSRVSLASASGMQPWAGLPLRRSSLPTTSSQRLIRLSTRAAKYRYRSGNCFNCGSLTIRAPYGAVGHGGHYHSVTRGILCPYAGAQGCHATRPHYSQRATASVSLFCTLHLHLCL